MLTKFETLIGRPIAQAVLLVIFVIKTIIVFMFCVLFCG